MTVPAPDCLATATVLPLLCAFPEHSIPSQFFGAHEHIQTHSVFSSNPRCSALPASLAQQCFYCCCHVVVSRHWVLLLHG
jgi:hypothetical protein